MWVIHTLVDRASWSYDVRGLIGVTHLCPGPLVLERSFVDSDTRNALVAEARGAVGRQNPRPCSGGALEDVMQPVEHWAGPDRLGVAWAPASVAGASDAAAPGCSTPQIHGGPTTGAARRGR